MFDYRVRFAAREKLAEMLAIAGLAGVLLLTLAGPAQSQFFGWWGSAPTNTVDQPRYSYPAHPDVAPVAPQHRVTRWIRHKTRVGSRHSRVKKTRTAAHKTSKRAAELARFLPACKITPTKAEPQPTAKIEPVTAAFTQVLPPGPSPMPAAQTDGPGYANGVPINPLD